MKDTVMTPILDVQLKWCSGCKQSKELSLFAKNQTWCRSCQASHRQKPEVKQQHQDLMYAYRLKFRYNLTVEAYTLMLKEQQGVCKICKQLNPSNRRLAVDHDHKTGSVRGLLCNRCNTAVGWLERPGYIEQVKAYLLERV